MRFDVYRNTFLPFLMLWIISAQWVYFCMIPVFIVNQNISSSLNTNAVKVTDVIGWLLFIVGWAVEIMSDYQKTQFKKKESNAGLFIMDGIWKYSRHPNYFGEILLWFGIAICASSVMNVKSSDWLLFLSPFWTCILLLFVSGIPASENAANMKYGHLESYREYKRVTPILVPFCCCY